MPCQARECRAGSASKCAKQVDAMASASRRRNDRSEQARQSQWIRALSGWSVARRRLVADTRLRRTNGRARVLKVAYYCFIAALVCASVDLVAGPWPRWVLLALWAAVTSALFAVRIALRRRAVVRLGGLERPRAKRPVVVSRSAYRRRR